jgi:hypothetical protein
MTEPTRLAATVTGPGMVRTSEGLIRCPDAERLPVGSHLLVEIASDSQGEHAVAISGAASFARVNLELRGNPWRE